MSILAPSWGALGTILGGVGHHFGGLLGLRGLQVLKMRRNVHSAFQSWGPFWIYYRFEDGFEDRRLKRFGATDTDAETDSDMNRQLHAETDKQRHRGTERQRPTKRQRETKTDT